MTAPKVIRFRGGFDYIYKTTGSAADLLDKLQFIGESTHFWRSQILL